jgi:hypothetical protein
VSSLSRNRILVLTMVADIVGAVVIVGILPLSFSTSLVVLVVYGATVFYVSQMLRHRAGGE